MQGRRGGIDACVDADLFLLKDSVESFAVSIQTLDESNIHTGLWRRY